MHLILHFRTLRQLGPRLPGPMQIMLFFLLRLKGNACSILAFLEWIVKRITCLFLPQLIWSWKRIWTIGVMLNSRYAFKIQYIVNSFCIICIWFQTTELKKDDPTERLNFGGGVLEDIENSPLSPEEYVRTMIMTDQSSIVLHGGPAGRTMVICHMSYNFFYYSCKWNIVF